MAASVKMSAFFSVLAGAVLREKADVISDFTRTTKACLGKQNNMNPFLQAKCGFNRGEIL